MLRRSVWRTALTAFAAVAVLLTVPLTVAEVAHAQTYPPRPPPSLSLSQLFVVAGDPVRFTAKGFDPNQQVVAVLRDRPSQPLGTFQADARGRVSGSVTIPRSTGLGFHQLQLKGQNPNLTASAFLFVFPRLTPHAGESSQQEEQQHAKVDAGIGPRQVGGAAALVALGGGAWLGARRLRNGTR
ncbi:hypothetical protein O7599_05465 [Streptomyces sp. WMMC500]|uniref:hypothetical protein n=1 Tax=Streptomyces sp. WMMC500 TaxID=3015154 RepID=UPI00248D1908|nr:hypothetical protein [Streptomyces sp. WMMC500]WBB61992.1 hypothetical protein O7599_05465 [Streptomyces sp. WMMC500]